MSRKLKVLGCQENCPYFVATGYHYCGSCDKANKTITKEDIHNKKPIPDWCPLEPHTDCTHGGCSTFKAGDYIWCSSCGAIQRQSDFDKCIPIGEWTIPKG